MNKKHLTKEQQSQIAFLIAQNKHRLVGYIRTQFKDISDADIEDCLQELFLRAYKKFSSFEHSSDKNWWLFNTMQNIMHEFCRKKKRICDHTIPILLVSESEEEFEEEKDLIFEIITNHSDELQIIKVILSYLTEKERLLYKFRYIDNFSTNEIAKRLSVPSGSIRGRLSDLKKKVKKLIHEYETLQWDQKENFSENFLKNFEHSDKK